jgi:Endonuclease/Exonuclease/phosphatase family
MPPSTTIQVVSYNVQAPFLPSEKGKKLPEDVRWRYIWRSICNAVGSAKNPVFVCLQEVCTLWLDMIRSEMEGMDFAYIANDYSPLTFRERKPLFTVIFYQPRFFTCQQMLERLTGSATADQKERLGLTPDAIAMNGRKCNAIQSGLFTSTGASGGLPAGKQLVVATYHAPCIHIYPRSQALHFENALTFLQEQNVPAILAGDLNTKPTDGAYRLVTGVRDFMSALNEKRHVPTSCSSEMEPSCLDYIFGNKHVVPELIRVQSFCNRNILCEAQPSDHGILYGSFSIQ